MSPLGVAKRYTVPNNAARVLAFPLIQGEGKVLAKEAAKMYK